MKNTARIITPLFFLYSSLITHCTPSDPNTALLEAATRCDTETVKALLDSPSPGLDINHGRTFSEKECNDDIKDRETKIRCQDDPGITPLMLASRHRCTDVARMLLANGALPDQQRAKGTTALIDAVSSESIGIVKLLLEYGADPHHVRKDNHPVSDFTLNEEILEMLK